MSIQRPFQRFSICLLLYALSTCPGAALPLEDFAKFPQDQQGQFISASIGMVAYIAAADGDVERSRCVQRYYFGTDDQVGEGVEAIATEITIAERIDPKKFHIQGIILGVLERQCGPGAPSRRSADVTKGP